MSNSSGGVDGIENKIPLPDSFNELPPDPRVYNLIIIIVIILFSDLFVNSLIVIISGL